MARHSARVGCDLSVGLVSSRGCFLRSAVRLMSLSRSLVFGERTSQQLRPAGLFRAGLQLRSSIGRGVTLLHFQTTFTHQVPSSTEPAPSRFLTGRCVTGSASQHNSSFGTRIRCHRTGGHLAQRLDQNESDEAVLIPRKHRRSQRRVMRRSGTRARPDFGQPGFQPIVPRGQSGFFTRPNCIPRK